MNRSMNISKVCEINDLFFDFFHNNLDRLSRQMPSMVVDGTIQPYHACLPKHISCRLATENQKDV